MISHYLIFRTLGEEKFYYHAYLQMGKHFPSVFVSSVDFPKTFDMNYVYLLIN